MAPSSSAARPAPGVRPLAACWLAAGLCLPLAAQGQPQPIGEVLTSEGTVTVDTPAGVARLAGPDESLHLGEVVRTQAGSRAELRLRDGTRMQVAANSVLHLTEFVLKPDQPAQERLATRLMKGALRVLTGAIAQRQPVNARFSTPTATLGIRGTDFVMRICDDDCRLAEDATVARAGGEFIGRLGGAAGGVSAIDAQGRWRVLPLSAPLRAGDRVITGASGVALLVLRDGTRVALDPGSRLWLREFQFDEAAPRQGRIRIELQRGAAQVTSGQLARLRPERFQFEAGGQVLRAHGTAWGAVVEVVATAAGQAADTARDLGQSPAGGDGPATRLAQLAVTEGAVSLRGDGAALRLEAGQRVAARGKDWVPAESAPAFQAPDPRGVSVDAGRFFGSDLGQVAQAGQAPSGTYVHVHDGAVALAQGGEEVVLTQGETALAPMDGGVPRKVRNGVRVASSGALGLPATIAGPVCRPGDPPASPAAGQGWRPTLAAVDAQSAAFQGAIDGKLTEKDVRGRVGGDGGSLGGNRFGANFAPAGREGLASEARGTGLQGAGGLQVTQNVVTGRLSDTFAGNLVNNAQGGGVTLGGQPGRVGNTDRGGQVASGMSVYAGSGGVGFAQPMTSAEVIEGLQAVGGPVTGQGHTDTAELAYAQSVGTEGYAATKDMTASQRLAYWTAERDSQARGSSGRPREDDNPSGGGSGIPIFLGSGQFGNEIRGVERAVNARVGRAGGAGDGRGDQQAAGGGGGVAMQRGAQLGAPSGAGPSGTLNLDAALSINQLVNPGRQ